MPRSRIIRIGDARLAHPNIEFDIFICHCFDIKSDCGDSGDRLIEFEFIQDS